MIDMAVFADPQQTLSDLPYGDLAIALYASPDGLLANRAPLEDIADAAAKGVAALGGLERVRHIHRKWTEWNCMFLRRQISEAAYAAAIELLLESMTTGGDPADVARLERCIGLDYGRLIPGDETPPRVRTRDAHARRHPYATVPDGLSG